MIATRIWRHGRLAWPLVAGSVLLCAWLLLFDLAWRVLVLPFPVIAAIGLLAAVTGLAILVAFARRAARRAPTAPDGVSAETGTRRHSPPRAPA